MQITEYDPETGKILGVWMMDDETAANWKHPHVIGRYIPMEHFVDITVTPPTPKKRPPQNTRQSKAKIAPDGVEVVTLSGLPVPCRVEVGVDEYEVTDGVFEWGTRRAGTYPLRVVAFPFLDWEGTVTAE